MIAILGGIVLSILALFVYQVDLPRSAIMLIAAFVLSAMSFEAFSPPLPLGVHTPEHYYVAS
ncbi:MAG: hypothetical protein HYX88_04230 [Chloroflexi bacterium]|nr:hypothetical protein [Chloroflexota bacterium]